MPDHMQLSLVETWTKGRGRRVGLNVCMDVVLERNISGGAVTAQPGHL